MNIINKVLIQKGQQLLKNPSTISLKVVNTLLPTIVPFNQSHHIKINSITSNKITTFLPLRRSNKNHVATMHACAIATLGEFTAGILLMREVPLDKYRMILQELSTDYHFQAKEDLFANVTLPAGFADDLKILNETGILSIPLVTSITQQDGKKIATTTTLWHLKQWSLTHTAK